LSSFIRQPKNFGIGMIFLSVGLSALVIGSDYSLGSAARMGPGYFPRILGALLACIGAIGVIRSFFGRGEPIGRLAIKGLLLVLTAVLVFGFLMRFAGMVPAVIAMVLIGASANSRFNWKQASLLAIGLGVLSTLLFVFGLGLPLPLFVSPFGD
jgi:hypothetical protein